MNIDMTPEDQDRINAAIYESVTASQGNSTASQANKTAFKWSDPLPLAKCYESLPYPVEALPELVREAVLEMHGYIKSPVALLVGSAISLMSAGIQHQIDVARDRKLSGPVGLYFLSIAASGERKSTGDSAILQPLREYEINASEAKAPEIRQYRADIEAHSSKLSGYRNEIKKLAGASKPTTKQELALRDLMDTEPKKPKVPKVLVTDTTPEALAHKLATEWPSGALISDEGGIVFGGHGMGSESVVRYLTLLNKLWDGKPVDVKRRSVDSFTVNNPRFTVHIQIQMDTLQEFLDKNGRIARGSGFFARCLICNPVSTQGDRMYDDPPDTTPNVDAFIARMSAILSKDAVLNDRDELDPALMQLSPQAKAIWVDFFNSVESQLKAGGEYSDIRDVASKIADNAVRLAALFSYFETETPSTPVSKAHMESAIAIAAWHLMESQRFFADIAIKPDERAAMGLNDWLVNYCKTNDTDRITRRHIQQYGPPSARDRAKRDKLLANIESAGRVRFEGGRTQLVILNPALLSEVSG